jgi:tetratricopeptide (TPR) repeat protein
MISRMLLYLFFGLAFISPAQGQTGANKAGDTPAPGAAPAQSAVPTAEGTHAAGAAPASVPNLVREATQHYRQGDLEAAQKEFEAVLQQDAKSTVAYAGLTQVYLKQEKIHEAEEIAFKRADFAADKPVIEDARGEVYFRKGEIAAAEREFVKAVNADPSWARPRLGLARIYQAASLYRRAKTMIDSAYQMDPEDPDIIEFRLGTLRRSERIKSLEALLASEDKMDAKDREDMQTYVDYLKQEEARPTHTCRLATKVTSTETPLEYLLWDPSHARGYGLNVSINGKKATLMLDTGASGLLVSRGLGEKAGITKVLTLKVRGIGDKGDPDSYAGFAESIKIGKLEFRDCPVEVLEKRSVVGDDGLIGGDVFEDFLMELDFYGRKMRLGELPKRPNETAREVALQAGGGTSGYSQGEAASDAKKSQGDAASKTVADLEGPQDRYIAPEMQSYTRVFRFGHMLLVPTKINDISDKLFLLDTGALSNQITPGCAREITKVHDDPDMTVSGVNGYVKRVYSADKVMLQFGHLRQENQDLLSFDLSSTSRSIGSEICGTIGFVTLHLIKMKIDYRDGLVDFQYDPNGR